MNGTGHLIRIIADDRERAGGVIDSLRHRSDVALTVQRLPAGDFLVESTLVVERKTLRDFAVSVIDGRWFRQTSALAGGSRRPVIVLEGTTCTVQELGITHDSLQGALITASVFLGVAVIRARDADETARLLVYIGRQHQRACRGALPRHGYRPKGKRARQIFVLQGLPGIGPDRAERLLQQFGSVKNVLTATSDELAATPGIGPTTAAKIRWMVEER